jgi:hypothetical protein
MNHTLLLSRRKALKHLLQVVGGLKIFALLPPVALKELPFLRDQGPLIPVPYWLQVLSRGINYIPQKAAPEIKQWEDVTLQQKAYQVLDRAIETNLRVHDTPLTPPTSDMNQIVIDYKTSQYLIEHIQKPYSFSNDFPPITFLQDPMRAKIFYDLALVILNQIIGITQESEFERFTVFEIKLLQSAEAYLREGIKTIESAHRIAPDYFKSILKESVDKGYDYLEFTLKLLEQVNFSRVKVPLDYSLKLKIESLVQILPGWHA